MLVEFEDIQQFYLISAYTFSSMAVEFENIQQFYLISGYSPMMWAMLKHKF